MRSPEEISKILNEVVRKEFDAEIDQLFGLAKEKTNIIPGSTPMLHIGYFCGNELKSLMVALVSPDHEALKQSAYKVGIDFGVYPKGTLGSAEPFRAAHATPLTPVYAVIVGRVMISTMVADDPSDIDLSKILQPAIDPAAKEAIVIDGRCRTERGTFIKATKFYYLDGDIEEMPTEEIQNGNQNIVDAFFDGFVMALATNRMPPPRDVRLN